MSIEIKRCTAIEFLFIKSVFLPPSVQPYERVITSKHGESIGSEVCLEHDCLDLSSYP